MGEAEGCGGIQVRQELRWAHRALSLFRLHLHLVEHVESGWGAGMLCTGGPKEHLSLFYKLTRVCIGGRSAWSRDPAAVHAAVTSR